MNNPIDETFALLLNKNNTVAYKALQLLQRECEQSDSVICWNMIILIFEQEAWF